MTAVGQTAGEDLFFGGAAFTLEVATGKLAGGGGFFTIINREGEKFLAGFGARGSDGGHDNNAFTELHGDGAVGLFGEFPGFDMDGIRSYLDRYFVWHNISIMPVDPEELHSTPAMRTLNEISQCQRASVCAIGCGSEHTELNQVAFSRFVR